MADSISAGLTTNREMLSSFILLVWTSIHIWNILINFYQTIADLSFQSSNTLISKIDIKMKNNKMDAFLVISLK